MARAKNQLQYKIAKRTFPNGTESREYYSQVKNEYGKKIWLKLGSNFKEAQRKQKEELEAITERKRILEQSPLERLKAKQSQSFLDYLKEKHYFEPELNVQYVFYKRTGRESYGLHHSKQVSGYLHRLFDEDKGNDPIGEIPYGKITHQDALELWKRLESSTIFQTNTVRNRLIDILSSTYSFIQKDDPSLPENPFRTIAKFNDSSERKEREGMTIQQVRLLFADEETINKKVVKYLIAEDEKSFIEKSETIMSSDKSEVQKQRLLKNLKTWSAKKQESYKDYRFTDTQYYKYFKFILGTGLRSAECRALQYSSFVQFPYVLVDKSFKEQTSNVDRIEEPKWGKKRIVYMCPTLESMMSYAKPKELNVYTNKYAYSKSPDAFVFSQDEDGTKPLCSNELRKKWTMFVSAMGFEPHLFTPHSLRHSIAALMMDNGIPEWFVVKWCGWETSTTSKMVLNYAKKKWNYEYPEFKDQIAPLIEEKYFSLTLL